MVADRLRPVGDHPLRLRRGCDPRRAPQNRHPRHVPPRPPRRLRLADPGRRLRGGVVVLAFVLSLFGARLVQLQGLDAPTYAAAAEQGRLRTVALPAARGTITDRNGVALATTVAAVNITSDQTKVVDPAATARALAPVLKMDAVELQEKLTGDARFVYVAKTVTPATWRAVRDLDHPDPDIEGLPGIYAEQTSKRVYPAGQVGANIVGFVGAEGKGLGGIEYALDSTLAGRDGTATYELSAGGRRIPSGVDTERDAVPGTDVRLTIDRDIQYVAQRAIAKAVASTRSQSGTVIVYRPSTGDLLAVATAPTFDPNKPGAAPAEDRGNRAAVRGVRARQHRQDHHRLGPDRGGRDPPDHADHGAQPADPGRQDLQGLREPPGAAPHVRRHASRSPATSARSARPSGSGTSSGSTRTSRSSGWGSRPVSACRARRPARCSSRATGRRPAATR